MGTCLATCCGSYCGNACAQCPEGSKESRFPYMVTLFLGMIIGAALRYWGQPWDIDAGIFGSVDVCTSDKCYGFGAAYRMSFTLFVFFFVHALFMLSNGTQALHRRFWVGKFMLFIVLFFVCYWIPNSFFDVYSDIARFVSAVFLLLQLIILIDFAYAWNEAWTSSDQGVASKGDYGVLGASLLLLGASLTLLIFCFKWFNGDGCENNAFFLGFTITLTSLALIISITSWCEHGALLPSALMTLYAWWLAFSAMSSDPTGCNTVNTNDTAQVVIGMIVAAATITYAGLNLSNSKSLFGGEDTEEVGMLDKSDGDEESARPAAAVELTDEEWEVIRQRNLKFHLVMSAASMYVAMLLTNWGFLSSDDTEDPGYDLGKETVWIKIVTQWVVMLLYLWTLIAPQLLTDRDWSA